MVGLLEAPIQEGRQLGGIPDDGQPGDRILGDVQGRAEHVVVAAEEVR